MTNNFGSDGSPISVSKLRTLENAHDSEGVISPGTASPGTNNFDVDVSAGVANVQGSRVSFSSGTVTHNTSDTEDRIDLITVNGSGTLSVTTGTAANTSGQPNAPDIPAGEVLIAIVEVRGGSSEILSGDIFNGYKTIKEEIEDLTTTGSDGQVPTAQSDGSLQMEDGIGPATQTDLLFASLGG